jgi:hypothetical protein
VAVRIQMRRGTTSEWNNANPVLNEGEIGYNSTTGQFKIGDGTTAFASLAYFSTAGDIEGVTAGTGLTGGGVSGTVTLNVDTTVVATTNNTLTFSNKTIALGSNTVSGTLAEFNSALTDADFATIGGSETLTNKTLTSPSVGTSLTTASTSFDLLNTTATTINLGGAATVLSIGAASGTATFNNSVVITGDLTVNGTTTTIDTQTLQVEDKNIVIAYGNTTDAGADGGGLTLLGATNKTFEWIDATDAWTSSEHMNLLSGKSYKINNVSISAALPGLTWGEVKDGKSGLVIS